MASPVCPEHYKCVFTPEPPPYPGPWWEAPHAWIVFLIGAVLLCIVLCAAVGYAVEVVKDGRERRAAVREADRKRAHQLAVEEQRTMQLDAARGNPEVLRIVREEGSRG